MSVQSASRRNTSLIRGLQYFEVVARHQSVKLAAAELGVSQSAVSHQLRELTATLGEQLVTRAGRGIALTPTGLRLAERLAAAFAGLQASVDNIVGKSRQTLRLAVCSSFAPGWLIGRLPDFMASHPDIDLQLRLYAHDPELTGLVADAIVTAQPVKPGFSSLRLFDESLVAVHAWRTAPKDSRLITTDLDEGRIGKDWSDYCALTGLSLGSIQHGAFLQCTHFTLALEMARAGLGIALVPDFLAQRDIETGLLTYFHRARMPSNRVYHLCYKHSRGKEPGIQAVLQWFRAQLAPASVVKLRRSTRS